MKKLIVLSLTVAFIGLVTASADDKKADKHDGKKGEIPAKVLEKYDKNKNGKLDADEKEAFKKDNEEHRKEMLKKFDKNGDGKLDDAEKEAAKAAGKEHHKGEKKGDKKK